MFVIISAGTVCAINLRIIGSHYHGRLEWASDRNHRSITFIQSSYLLNAGKKTDHSEFELQSDTLSYVSWWLSARQSQQAPPYLYEHQLHYGGSSTATASTQWDTLPLDGQVFAKSQPQGQTTGLNSLLGHWHIDKSKDSIDVSRISRTMYLNEKNKLRIHAFSWQTQQPLWACSTLNPHNGITPSFLTVYHMDPSPLMRGVTASESDVFLGVLHIINQDKAQAKTSTFSTVA